MFQFTNYIISCVSGKNGYFAFTRSKWTLFLVLCFFSFSHSQNVELLAHFDEHSFSDVWGYDSEDDGHFVIAGATEGTYVYDVSDAASGEITEIAFFPGPGSRWRDIKTYKNYAYVVNDDGDGELLILNMSYIPDSVIIVSQKSINNYHNLFIDETNGLMYWADDSQDGKTIIMSLEDPENPVYVGEFGTETHDIFVRGGLAFTAEGRKGSVGIFDVSKSDSVSEITKLPIPDPGYVHNTWTNSDNSILITTEETRFKTIKIWDINDLQNIELLSTHIGPSFLPHNAHIEGDYAYVSHYRAGMIVIDLKDPRKSGIVGRYDTHLENDEPQFGGNWGVYPHSSSGNIYLSGENGLFVVKFNGTGVHHFSGNIIDAETNEFVGDARIDIKDFWHSFYSDFNGNFGFGYGISDSIEFTIGAFGYIQENVKKEIVSHTYEKLNVSLKPAPRSDLRGIIKNMENQPILNARVSITVNDIYLDDPITYQTFTNENGFYLFENLPVSEENVRFYTNFTVDRSFPFAPLTIDTLSIPDIGETVVDVSLSTADVLVINLDSSNDYSTFVTSSLKELGKTATVITEQSRLDSLSSGDLSLPNENYIIVISGDAETGFISESALDTLQAYVESGGNFILSGQNFAEFLSTADSNFLNWLNIGFEGNSDAKMLTGLPFTSIGENVNRLGLLSTESADNQESPEILNILDSVNTVPILEYRGSDGEYGAVGTKFGEEQGRVFFAGFGLEGVSAGSPAFTNRAQLIDLIEDWFQEPFTTIPIGETGTVIKFELEQNFPNPFNPSTTIRYTLAKPGHVKVDIYTITGKKVVRLFDGMQQAGTHSLVFDASDLASGLYFYNLQTPQFKATQKMLLVR